MSTCRYSVDTINLDLTEISPFAIGRLTYGEAVWGAGGDVLWTRADGRYMANMLSSHGPPRRVVIAGGRAFVVVSQQNYVKPKSSGAAQQQVWATD